MAVHVVNRVDVDIEFSRGETVEIKDLGLSVRDSAGNVVGLVNHHSWQYAYTTAPVSNEDTYVYKPADAASVIVGGENPAMDRKFSKLDQTSG